MSKTHISTRRRQPDEPGFSEKQKADLVRRIKQDGNGGSEPADPVSRDAENAFTTFVKKTLRATHHAWRYLLRRTR